MTEAELRAVIEAKVGRICWFADACGISRGHMLRLLKTQSEEVYLALIDQMGRTDPTLFRLRQPELCSAIQNKKWLLSLSYVDIAKKTGLKHTVVANAARTSVYPNNRLDAILDVLGMKASDFFFKQ